MAMYGPFSSPPPAPPRPPSDRRDAAEADPHGADALATQVGGSHYKGMAIQPVEYIHRNGIGFCEGSAIKYLSRWRQKGGLQDLRKARHFIDLLIEMEKQPATGHDDHDGG